MVMHMTCCEIDHPFYTCLVQQTMRCVFLFILSVFLSCNLSIYMGITDNCYVVISLCFIPTDQSIVCTAGPGVAPPPPSPKVSDDCQFSESNHECVMHIVYLCAIGFLHIFCKQWDNRVRRFNSSSIILHSSILVQSGVPDCGCVLWYSQFDITNTLFLLFKPCFAPEINNTESRNRVAVQVVSSVPVL